MTRAAPLRQSELTAYAKAMAKAGVRDWRVEVEKPGGRVSIIVGRGDTPMPESDWADLE
jgi:hypothetical protein